MMTFDEFKRKAMSVPWVRGGDYWAGSDCWGVVVLYLTHVIGMDASALRGGHTELRDGWAQADRSGWREVAPAFGVIVFCRHDSQGRPRHCGIYLGNGLVLHSPGTETSPAMPVITRLEQFGRDPRYWAPIGVKLSHEVPA